MERVGQFLPEGERDALYQAACAAQKSFHPPGGPGAPANGTLYWSLDDDGSEAGVRPLREAIGILSQRVLERFPSLFTALGIDPFPVSEISLSLINGLDGHAGTPHEDSTGGRYQISLLYYFHRIPKAFQGGDLEFYETDPESTSGHGDEPFARIEHEDNLLIAFPSETFHGVTGVQSDSSNFADGRFVAVGFVGSQ